MASVFGVFGAESFVVLIVASIGLIPVALYYEKTPREFTAAYGFLFVAAVTTNFEDLLLPTVMNLGEHFVGNLGAGLAFAVAAYTYRRRSVTAEAGGDAAVEG